MENKYSITLDPKPQKSKPQGKIEIARINNSLRTITGLTITEISEILTQPYSYTWSPAIFNGYRSNSTWVEQQLYTLDFDGGIEPKEVIERFKEYGITPNLIYYTFSDMPEKRKFRVILFLDKVVNDKDLNIYLQKGLLRLFPEADQSCKDLSRIFFGGTYGEVLSSKPIVLQKIFDCVSITESLRGPNTSKKSIQTRSLVYYIYTNTRDQIDFNTTDIGTPEYLKTLKKTIFDFNECSENVKIFKDFLNGKWLHHPELFGIATNLHWLNGGLKVMRSTMDKYNSLGLTKYTQNNYNILDYVKKMEYKPQSLKKFSPYSEDHTYTNLITSVKDIRGHIEVPEKKDTITLQEGRSRFISVFNEVIEKNDNKIYILKVPTGIGKTELLTTLSKPSVLCFPTHDLLKEVSQRMKVEHVSTPQIPRFADKTINRRIEHLYNIGLYKKVYQLLKIILKDNTGKYNEGDKKMSRNYLCDLEASLGSSKTILTTHHRSLITPLNENLIIYDEDPLSSILEIKTMRISDLYQIERTRSIKDDVSTLLNYLQDTPCGLIHSNPVFDIKPDTLIDLISSSEISSNVIGFLNSTHFIKNKRNKDIVHYITRKDLPKDKTIVILSASVPVKFYEKLYGDRVESLNLSNIEQKGKIIQHTSKSYSRVSLRRSKGHVKGLSTDCPVITFKEFSDTFNDDLNIYYGNCEGYDNLKGKNINVVGTPHLNNIVYLLYGSSMGIPLSTMDNVMSYQKTEWNGYKFKFQTYDNPDLRDIQLSLIESELKQAVGRARTLTTDAEVNIYSNFPLQISTKFEY